MTDYSYLLIPFIAWFVTGVTKFIVSSLRTGSFSFDQIGYGGMPSNHSSIVTSVTALIALKEGIAHPAFGVAICFSYIVILDAGSLRKQIGAHAKAINQLSIHAAKQSMREKVGHSRFEIAMGIFTGLLIAYVVDTINLSF